MDPIEFLRARYDEDEQDAKQPPNGHLSHGTDPVGTVNRECPDCRTPYARTRMLAEVEAKRRILERIEALTAHNRVMPSRDIAMIIDGIVIDLVLPYADDPDFDPAWRI